MTKYAQLKATVTASGESNMETMSAKVPVFIEAPDAPEEPPKSDVVVEDVEEPEKEVEEIINFKCSSYIQ